MLLILNEGNFPLKAFIISQFLLFLLFQICSLSLIWPSPDVHQTKPWQYFVVNQVFAVTTTPPQTQTEQQWPESGPDTSDNSYIVTCHIEGDPGRALHPGTGLILVTHLVPHPQFYNVLLIDEKETLYNVCSFVSHSDKANPLCLSVLMND